MSASELALRVLNPSSSSSSPPSPPRPAPEKPRRPPKSFYTDTPMTGPPSYSWKDLRHPMLRKATLDLKDIRWLEHLGGGQDGYCWKVAFGDQGPFVLKMFWDDERPDVATYWAPERECQNVAVLQMMEASLRDHGPVRLYDYTDTRANAIENLYAFSEEGRKKPRIPDDMDLTVEQLWMHRTRQCFGWLKLTMDSFGHRKNRPPVLVWLGLRRPPPQPGREYFAMVYEYIEEDELDDEGDLGERKEANRRRISVSMGFLSLIGFEFPYSWFLGNWKNGILLDLSEIVFPFGYGTRVCNRRQGNAFGLQQGTVEVHVT
ncbi:hypothetical protein GGTG_04642 [Gaeumannomyces tritici R3-111a-1]|uniref:Protein kinase domain-containing protein n=1 Tax=Gaeumannomyces tritici (strain R3-111a-1) TaxID=644352 RepID=J3NTP2_GAET3|nr:hypothetical protein GGTG_04642 [Gaeumannomyces tritici R3-111a-1]EJT79557.1 hypothetical protein GGTG_04642 [Gaeumannomyces tritici R3-111a-1]